MSINPDVTKKDTSNLTKVAEKQINQRVVKIKNRN